MARRPRSIDASGQSLSLALEQPTREHLRSVQQITRDQERELLEATLNRQRTELAIQLLKLRLEFYASFTEQEYSRILALQLTQDPQSTRSVLDRLVELHEAESEQMLDVLAVLLKEDGVEGFELEESKDKILMNLKESLETLLGLQQLIPQSDGATPRSRQNNSNGTEPGSGSESAAAN